MKNKLLVMLGMSLALFSCAEDDAQTSEISPKTELSQKATNQDPYVLGFKKAIKEMSQLRYLPTKEYTEKYGNELSPERKQILYPAALELIYSTGITEEQLKTETNGDLNQILNKAFSIYTNKK